MREKTVTIKQMRLLDDTAINKYGVPSIALMENAGGAVVREVLRLLKGTKNPYVCVFCGMGNNAGDGFVAARHLSNNNIKTKIYLIGSPDKLKQDAFINYGILQKIKFPVIKVAEVTPLLKQDLKRADVIVDAVFGVGLRRDIAGLFKDVIDTLNSHAGRIVSVDVPSGLDGTTGKIYGACVKAHTTVTFSFAKKGFFMKHGPDVCGRIVVADIGIPKKVMREVPS